MADLSKFMEYARSFFLQRATLYCLIVLSSLFVIVPLGVLHTQLDEQCLLYANVEYDLHNNTGGSLHSVIFRFRFGRTSMCEYSLALSVLFSLIYPLAMVVVYVFGFRRERQSKDTDLGQVWFLVHGLMEVVLVLLMLVSACTVTHGFTTLCGHITDTKLASFKVDSCSDAESFNWRDYDVSQFYVRLSVATAGSWFQFVFWVLQAGLVLWKLWRLNMLPVLPDCLRPAASG